ncbi:MOSC domain-containing protein [Streptantibioticus silvisoli]|uniref:MOSC domain-containing protein n=1 Tax=Streptantibioticus silvisoli TaxID=2705255 RepID=A0ABT6VUJ3_9ACTN|nr:MOSC domain-containing protein [Streptantibioticus silvisoli]MDI5962141.1 MOSC domain-containing protein [Streptantibioticus silvisoli]
MARLVSVNVGLPQDVSWRGRTVRTGIWKSPVRGPRMVRRLNVDGDGQGDLAGHGGEMRAVMVYQLDSYRYWQRVLGRDDFVLGQFGENFTVEGLADDEVCLGDRYRIGDAVFEVTQPRVTCYRVGLRMAEPRMPALLVSHRRPGFYFRVLTEGAVEAGQQITKIASGPGRMTVTEVDGLLYLRDHPRDRIEQALRVDALSPGWQQSFRALLDQAGQGPGTSGNAGLSPGTAAPPPAWPGFRPLTVTAIRHESRSIVSLWLAAADGTPLPAAAPGQYLTLRLDPDDAGPALVRSYSLSGRPGADQYRVSVKREPHGAASARIHTRVREGDTLRAAAPRGSFVLAPGTGPLVLASAGVGATPVVAMLRAVADSASGRPVWWLHGARDGAEHAFAREVRELLDRLPGSTWRVCYSHPRPEDRPGTDYTDTGRLSGELLARAGLPTDADAYLCGPVAFMDDLTAALTAHGLPAGRVHREVFGTAAAVTPGIAPATAVRPHPPTGRPGPGPAVSFARAGLTVPWDPGHGTLLELAEACDVPVRWSCRTGVCHTCETAVLQGDVVHDPDPVEPPAAGSALICCSAPAADVVLDL